MRGPRIRQSPTASAVLAPEFASLFSDSMGPDILVAIPNRFRIFVFPKVSPAYQRFSEIVIAEYDSSTYPVSKELFSVRKGKIIAVGGTVENSDKRTPMLRDIRKILYHESTILSRLDELAGEITEDYRGKDLSVIAVLNGSFIFMADLLRRVPLHLQVECLSVSSYHGTKSTGRITFARRISQTFVAVMC